MIYNFNLGIGWASSGVEYAQIYRARMFRNIGVDAKFVFTDMFPSLFKCSKSANQMKQAYTSIEVSQHIK